MDTPVDILGANQPYTLVVEPWASQYQIQPEDKCIVLIKHASKVARVGVELNALSTLTVRARLSGSTYEFWRNGEQEDESPTPAP